MAIRMFRVIAMLAIWLAAGIALAAASETVQSIPQLRKAALGGDPWAQLNLGAAYDHGLQGLRADPQQAVIWYRKAAQQGLRKAQFNLAHCYATGDGVRQDYEQARRWMQKAAQQGMADAQFLLGVMLAEGLGGEPDKVEARQWLKQAAAGGNPDAGDYLKKRR